MTDFVFGKKFIYVKGCLPSFNIDAANVSVSGISSGAFFATQMQVTYSSLIMGAGIISGGPYDCARSQSYMMCMFLAIPSIAKSISNTKSWSGVKIDDVSYLARQRVFMFSGTLDATLSKSVMDELYKYYVVEGRFLKPENVLYQYSTKAAHTFPTDFAAEGNNACGVSLSPYISDCSYDGAGKLLEHIYKQLQPRNNAGLGGTFYEFDQSEFLSNPTAFGLANTGWVYVPRSCAEGRLCKLHVAFHGCKQSYSQIGDKFLKDTGYTKWADTNNLVILFPQTVVTRSVSSDSLVNFANLEGCFDWVGWYGAEFDTYLGKQMAVVRQMIARAMGTVTPALPITRPPDSNYSDVGNCFSSSNFDHVRYGRAYNVLTYAYAEGSNDYLGLFNVIDHSKVRETRPNFYVLDKKC